MYGCSINPDIRKIQSPRLVIYERNVSSCWGELPIHLKSCLLIKDIVDVQWSEGPKNLFVVLASTYLRTGETTNNIINDGTINANSAEVNLLLSVDNVQKRLAWTQWILSAKEFYQKRLILYHELLLQQAQNPTTTTNITNLDNSQQEGQDNQADSSQDSGNEADRDNDNSSALHSSPENSNVSKAGDSIARRYKLLRYKSPSRTNPVAAATGIGRIY